MKNKLLTLALLALTLNGCGSNDSGTNANSNKPSTNSEVPQDWKKLVSVAETYACAITKNEALKCWGANSNGTLPLGDDTVTEKLTPADTLLSSKVKSVSIRTKGGCANVDGAAQCWGSNSKGQLGDDGATPVGVTAEGKDQFSSKPVQVLGLTEKVTSIAAGSEFACAVVNGGVKCWGDNTNGALGDHGASITDINNPFSQKPVDVVGLTSGVQMIAAGTSHACALLNDGSVKCWGANYKGQLGIGSNTAENSIKTEPQAVTLESKAIFISAGEGSTCATLESGKIQCWGANANGILGNDTASVLENKPISVSHISSGSTRLALAGDFACAIVNGGLKCWGNNNYGQLGDLQAETQSKTPVDATLLAGKQIKDVATSSGVTCVIQSDNQLACWGFNFSGQLGNGTKNNSSTTALVNPTGF